MDCSSLLTFSDRSQLLFADTQLKFTEEIKTGQRPAIESGHIDGSYLKHTGGTAAVEAVA